MKKTAAFLFAFVMLFSVLAVSVYAEEEQVIKRGTAIVDGIVDEIYKDSWTVFYDGDPAKNAFTKSEWKGGTMTAYAVYDDDYLYMVADVKDDDVVSADKNWVETGFNPFLNDVVEFRLNYHGGRGVQFKVGVDAHGYRAYTIQDDAIDISTVIYKTTINEDGYVVEIAVPTTVKDGSCFFNKGKLGIKMWVFDLQASAEGKIEPVELVDVLEYSVNFGTSVEKRDHGAPVVYMLSEEYAKSAETTAPETAAPETAAPETAAPETAAPETAAPETAAPETAAPETAAPETAAPETAAPETKAPETQAKETDAPKAEDPAPAESNNMGLIIGIAAAVVVVAAAAVVIVKKKK